MEERVPQNKLQGQAAWKKKSGGLAFTRSQTERSLIITDEEDSLV